MKLLSPGTSSLLLILLFEFFIDGKRFIKDLPNKEIVKNIG
jgi:hypothetical protein